MQIGRFPNIHMPSLKVILLFIQVTLHNLSQLTVGDVSAERNWRGSDFLDDDCLAGVHGTRKCPSEGIVHVLAIGTRNSESLLYAVSVVFNRLELRVLVGSK